MIFPWIDFIKSRALAIHGKILEFTLLMIFIIFNKNGHSQTENLEIEISWHSA